jgi:hypothetical protein
MTTWDFVQGQSNLGGEFSSDNQQSSGRLLKQLSQATFCKHIRVEPFSHVGARIAHHVEQRVFDIWHAFGQEKRPKLAPVPLRDAYTRARLARPSGLESTAAKTRSMGRSVPWMKTPTLMGSTVALAKTSRTTPPVVSLPDAAR